MIIVGWTGKPFGTPAVVACGFWTVLILACLRMFGPTFKKAFLGTGPKPSKKEVVVTIAVSTVCGAGAFFLQLFARGYNGIFSHGTHDWQRAVMVISYWMGSFFLMPIVGIIFGLIVLVLLFTGCFCGLCCNCCCRGPLFRWLDKGGNGIDAAAISMVDEQFGKVIATLDGELSLAQKTVVIFVGDQ